MAKNGELSTVPSRLRFSEFANEELRDVQLGDVTEDSTERNGERKTRPPIMGVSKTDGIIPMEKRLIGKDIARYKRLEKDWFAYNPMRLNIGSIARWKGDGDVLVSPDYVVFRCLTEGDATIDPAYLDHFRSSDQWRDFVGESGDGGVRIRIYYKDLARLLLKLPSSPEQQKIADCLTSLNELIAAQGQQLAALTAHKRGLMQQLFPLEGETRPRRRFPDFRNTRDWSKRSMSQLLDRVSKPVEIDATARYREIGVRSHGKGVFHKESVTGKLIGNKRVFWVAPNAFVVNIIFAWEQAVATTSDAESGMIASHRFPMYLGKPNMCDVEFLKRAFLMPEGNRLLGLASPGGAGRNRTLGQAEFEKIEMFLPEDVKEQQRIADCLSALDAQIAAASEKLVALKTHKKGLMQQLFPSAEED